ncbi:glutamyl-tRNA reductase [Arthrobacter sp. UM1]|uniref:glutamyl-tRNA reductase n=1 Tax=Arthrobacter sp. UM1 TaxID=2766776 RepID=UPI001CF6B30B|nr:glutamyl-tRNA reductase [Arthrobacter sp. UM1]MCB4207812.1 glutamyl-tRNA reductase [Arthrobacter sp. UM1]
MVYLSLVATHADLDLERIGRMSAAASQVSSATADSPLARGVVVLATCNRFEIYTELESAQDAEAVRSDLVTVIAEASGLPERVVASSLTTLVGDDVPRHLFAVGAGLHSAVVGEREIAGQVRRSLVSAQTEGTATGGLSRLFQSATKTAKQVGSRTDLGAQGKSIVSVGLDLVESVMDPDAPFSSSSVVVFGTGAYAGATMALLRDRGVTDVSVYSQSGRAPEFTAQRGGRALDADSLPEALAHADLVIGCSGGDRRVSAEELSAARPEGKDLYVVDLALTHDFEPNVADLPGVELLTLESIRQAAPAEAASALEAAREIVTRASEDFIADRTARQVDSAVVALRRHTLSVLDRELEKVRAQHGCTAAAEEVEFALRRMVRQLLHVPTVRGRELASQGRADEYVAGLDALYGLAPEASRRESAPGEAGTAPHAQPGEGQDDGECPVSRSA